MNDIERDAILFARIAETEPGIVRTLGLLIGELTDPELEPDLLRRLGELIRRIGETVIARAERLGTGDTPSG
ncbi:MULTISPECIES: hypothetical protein [Thermocrispum]|jgi:hypothetical protein|uniref:Histidine kinase n=1 Tax=Thermocrispum agreste TaxID=37925 RepID=A0ABD6FCD1_9PSEU|nr:MULTISPECIES: hypothetical protein [Thermocrispum]